MPELSRFGGMVIYMLFMDTKQHNSLMYMCIMEIMRLLLELTGNYWQVLFPKNN